MTEPLFGGYPDPEPRPQMSTGERIRARQQAAIDLGFHPLTKLPLLVPVGGHTCKDCAHRVRNERHYPKCDQTSMSHCEQSDCRAWWPACIAWTSKEEGNP